MSDKELDVKALARDPGVLKGRARNTEMFKEWFKGKPISKIAEEYGLSRQRVDAIKKRDKWAQVAEELQNRAYSALSYEWKEFVGSITMALKTDWNRAVNRLLKSDDASLTPDERTHGRLLLDHLVKSSRLADDKPTSIQSTEGVVTHRVLLPAGVKRWGVIPPDAKVEQIEAKEVEKEKPKLSLSDVEDLDD